MHPSLDGVLAGVSRHGLTMHIEQGQLASSVVIIPAEISTEPHLVGVFLAVLFRVGHTEQQSENAAQSFEFFHFDCFLIVLVFLPMEAFTGSVVVHLEADVLHQVEIHDVGQIEHVDQCEFIAVEE